MGFYVPDWWDVNDGSVIPGSEFWRPDYEWPAGDFGFVWGCIWGDDSSWKVQYVDLSQVQQGVIRREDRFGYVELATAAFENPCFKMHPEEIPNSDPPRFIEVSKYNGAIQVTFAVSMKFNVDSGRPDDWQRLRIANME